MRSGAKEFGAKEFGAKDNRDRANLYADASL